MPAWPSGVRAARRVEAQDGEVAGAAAEVADQDGGRRGQAAGEARAGGFGFQCQRNIGQASVGVGATQAIRAQRVVNELTGEADRAADDDAGGGGDVAVRAGRGGSCRSGVPA